MFKLWATIIKDFRVLRRDGIGLALMFVMPVILVFVVTDIQESTFQMINKNKLPVLIINRDTGESGTQLIESINKIGLFKVYQLPKNQDTKFVSDSMKQRDVLVAVTIPDDFTRKVKAKAKNVAGKALVSFGLQADSVQKDPGEIDPLTLYYNPILQEQLRLSVQGGLRSALQLVESRETLRSLYFSINEKQLPTNLENEMLNNKASINEIPVSKNGSLRTPNAAQHNVPSWTIFAMFFVIMSLGGSVVKEKTNGSFVRLKTLPTNYAVGLLSKQITYVTVTVLQAAVIFSLGIFVFPLVGLPPLNVPIDVFGLLIVTIICGWCAVSYAICVGVFSKTQEQSNGFGAISIVILAAIGGLMVPSFAMDTSLKTVADFSPMHWCLQAYYGLFLEGGKLTDVMNYLVPLVLITLVLQFITFLGLKRKNLI
ncbi:ABC transporter permease [Mucilaginibacter sp. McL0603]|uniref:ABC transporter permease n=1 Tax=Mucilaginibacter sp. McL0603 TaxID=3415670 RepID=UPI003CF86881